MPSPAPLSLPAQIPGAKAWRSDGQEARTRLLDAGLKLFAEKGFAKTSTREIAQAAQANVASISYYFGDKNGLYRAVFEDPRYNPEVVPATADLSGLDIRSTIDFLLTGIIEPLKAGEQARLCMKLHYREMVEPTGMWQQEIERNIRPGHEALVQALGRHLGADKPDDETHRLAFAIAGLGIMLHVGMDVMETIRPALIATPQALDTYRERMLEQAMALVHSEMERRNSRRQSGSRPVAGNRPGKTRNRTP